MTNTLSLLSSKRPRLKGVDIIILAEALEAYAKILKERCEQEKAIELKLARFKRAMDSPTVLEDLREKRKLGEELSALRSIGYFGKAESSLIVVEDLNRRWKALLVNKRLCSRRRYFLPLLVHKNP